MPVIRVGVQAPQGSPGQVVDLDGPRASIASITNVSAEPVAYSLDGGSSWATLAAGASGGAATIDAGMLRMRKVSSGAYPANVDVDAAIFGLSDPSLSAAQVAATAALVSGAGNPTDLLTGPVQRVTITGALSATATQAAAATGTYYKARVAWNNNGASGTAKLRIAVNCDNDVHGLMVGQSAKRRDYEMTMGDGVMLVCGVPITRLTFSADGAITGGTHQLQVTFGN